MTIEERIFDRCVFDFKRLIEYGFINDGDSYIYEIDFMDDEFHVVIRINRDGSVSSSVIDKMNDEEYKVFRFDSQKSPFVSSVRSCYEALLKDIASNCCNTLLFSSKQANRISERIYSELYVQPDFPWSDTSGVFRHKDSGKWFALIMRIKWKNLLKDENEEEINAINLKINPSESQRLTSIKGIYPGFHMNHKNWITIVLDDSVSDNLVMQLVAESYQLTKKK